MKHLIQIRGTSGSGKSTLIRKLMSEGQYKPVLKNGKIYGYIDYNTKAFVVGSYKTACGGCDALPTQDEIEARINWAFDEGAKVVLFEGLIASHIAGRYVDLAEALKLKGIASLFVFLTTSLEKCYEHIAERRKRAGKDASTNPKNTENDMKTTESSRKNMLNALSEQEVVQLSFDEAFSVICKVIDNA